MKKESKEFKLSNKFVFSIGKITIPKIIWSNLWSGKTLCPDKYPNIISELLTPVSGCLVNIKGTDYNKSSIVVRAYCSHSGCREFKLRNNNLEFGHFEVFSSAEKIKHEFIKTRQVRGFERKIYKEILAEKPLERVFEDSVFEEDKEFLLDSKISRIKGMEVLRKIKSEMHTENDNHPNIITDLILEIEEMKKTGPGWIQRFSPMDPFYVQCWSAEQLDLLKFAKKNSKNDGLVGFLDASGSVVK